MDDGWKLRDCVIGLESTVDSHTGANIADAFLAVLDDYGIRHLLSTVTTDNGSNLVKMTEILEARSNDPGSCKFEAKIQHIACLGHILNLALQAGMRNGLKSEASDRIIYEENEEEPTAALDSGDILGKLRSGIKKIGYVHGLNTLQYLKCSYGLHWESYTLSCRASNVRLRKYLYFCQHQMGMELKLKLDVKNTLELHLFHDRASVASHRAIQRHLCVFH